MAAASSASWPRRLRPGLYNDCSSACVFGDCVAVVGGVDGRGYVVLLERRGGRPVREWWGEVRSGYFLGCAASGGTLYAAGDPGLYAFDLNLNVLGAVDPEGVRYNSVAAAGGYVYAVGYYQYDRLYVEKRAADLAPVASATYIEDGWYLAEAYGVAVDPSTGRVWVVGRYDDGHYERPLILIFDPDLRLVRKVAVPWMEDRLFNICFMGGHVYVSGNHAVFRLDRGGNLTAVRVGGGQLACANGKLFLFWHAVLEGGHRLGYTVLDAAFRELKTELLAEGGYRLAFHAPGGPGTDGRRVYAVAVAEEVNGTSVLVYAVPAGLGVVGKIRTLAMRITQLLKINRRILRITTAER